VTLDGGTRLGVDFGTSNTVAVMVGPAGRVRPLLFDGSPILPSAVSAGSGPGLLVGADALRAAVGHPAGLEPNPKRRVDEGVVWLGEREHPVVDLVAAVLARVAAEASQVAGGEPGEVVLTCPVAWAGPRLTVLAEAAERAGWPRARFVAEPVAAAAYFTTVLGRPVPAGRCVVVYDLGAGTFDVAVVRPRPRESGGFDVVASAGLADVGGLDLDAAVVRHARTLTAGSVGVWQRLDWPQQPADRQARLTLWQGARAVKEQLSRHPTGDLYLPLVDRQVHLTRGEFEAAARPLLDRTVTLTLRVLGEAGVAPEDVGGVFLVGGSSRIPLAATLLHRALRIAPTIVDHPELVVAEGALHVEPAAPAAVTGPVEPALTAAVTGPVEPAAPAVTGDGPDPVPSDAAPAGSPPPVIFGPSPADPAVSRPPRRRAVAALAGCLVLVVAVVAVVAVVRPWRDRSGAVGIPSDCGFYERFGDLAGTTVTVSSGIVEPEEALHLASYRPFEECTGVSIRYEGDSSFASVVTQRVASADRPDVVYVADLGLLRRLVATGRVRPAPPETAANVDRWYGKEWKAFGTVDGRFYAAPLTAHLKSLVWYSPKEFRDRGYRVPTTLDDLRALSDRIAAEGRKPWCAGVESGAATGWPGTDWVEDFLLRLSGPDEYDKWASHAKPFNSAEVAAAFDAVGGYLKNERYVNGGHGGVVSVVTTRFQDAGLPILRGACSLHRQAAFYANQWPDGTRVAGDGDVFAFTLPGRDTATRPVVAAADFVVAFADRPEVRAFQTFLSSDWWANLRAAQGGLLVTANTGLRIDLCGQCTPLDRLSLEVLREERTVVRLDASDAMPAVVGTAFWRQLVDWLNGRQSTRQTIDNLEAAWPR
jgi:alpha-glucoside transport system substrate-binding protein